MFDLNFGRAKAGEVMTLIKLNSIIGLFQLAVAKEDGRHWGFARGHPPYYWPSLNTLNFLDRTG